MDVLDVKTSSSTQLSARAVSTQNQRPVSELAAKSVKLASQGLSISENPVRVELSDRPERATKSREGINEVVSTLNVVAKATEEIDQIVGSLAGIVEQAADENLSDSRRQILEREGEELLAALDERAKVRSNKGLQPLQGDPIELEIEEKLGETLEIILPETSTESLGLVPFSVSKVDTILRTREAIRSSRNQIQQLKERVTEAQGSVREVLERVDIAAQNRNAANSSIRDVDAALVLTGKIQGVVQKNPETALNAFSPSPEKSIRLLGEE